MPRSPVSVLAAAPVGLLLCLLGLVLAGCDLLDADGAGRRSGEAARPEDSVPGVSPDTIRIGSSLALTGHAAFLGRQTLHGALAYIQAINDEGGVHGRRISLIALDDGYEPALCLANTQRLIVEEEVFALFSYVGTPTTVKIIPLVKKARIPLVGMFTGANALREPFNPYIINVRASYYQETGAAVRHFVEDLGLTRIAVFYQYDAYGLDGLRGAELALKDYGLAPLVKSSYIRGTLDVEEGLDKILNSEAQAVVMIGTYEPSAKFIRLAKASGKKLVFYNVSFVGVEELMRLLGAESEGVIVSQVVPPPELPQAGQLLGMVDAFAARLARAFPHEVPNSVSLEGYLNAMVLVEGLRRAGPEPTRRRLIEGIQSIRELPLGPGAAISFSPTDHQGMDQVYFTRMRGGRLTLVTDWSDLDLGMRPGRALP